MENKLQATKLSNLVQAATSYDYKSSMDDETATETAEQAVNVKIAVENGVCNVDVKSHFCEHHSDPPKLNARNVANNATKDFELNVHFQNITQILHLPQMIWNR